MSAPSASKVAPDNTEKVWKRARFQTFVAITLGYALYYVCRMSMGVMKQPIIDAGLLNATQLGIIGACLYWTYAVGKLVNGFLADSSNIKRFMATGLILSVTANFLMGVLGVAAVNAGISSSVIFVVFAIMWAMNGWAQSMGVPPSVVALSRWFPLKIRGTFYGFFSASHNIGEGLSFVFVGSIVAAFGWKWGFFGAACAGILGVLLIVLWLYDTPESKGLPSIEELSGEAVPAKKVEGPEETRKIQRAVLRNPGVWILALSSAFMYMSRYAINEWGTISSRKPTTMTSRRQPRLSVSILFSVCWEQCFPAGFPTRSSGVTASIRLSLPASLKPSPCSSSCSVEAATLS